MVSVHNVIIREEVLRGEELEVVSGVISELLRGVSSGYEYFYDIGFIGYELGLYGYYDVYHLSRKCLSINARRNREFLGGLDNLFYLDFGYIFGVNGYLGRNIDDGLRRFKYDSE